MAINVKQKGNAGEREAAKVLFEAIGIKLIRNHDQANSGGYDLIVSPPKSTCSQEVISMFSNIALEVKNYKEATKSIKRGWWKQTLQQSIEYNNIPVLMYKLNRKGWKIFVPLWFVENKNEEASYRTAVNSIYEMTVEITVECFIDIIERKCNKDVKPSFTNGIINKGARARKIC